MRLQTVFCRFYKSFNFDHLRKAHPKAKQKPWEDYEGAWFPYIEIPIDRQITTVVGANESGKSHLLGAVKKAITGRGFSKRDLCRYSPYFNVERGNECWAHLGLAWGGLSAAETEEIRTGLSGGPVSFEHFLMFREGPDAVTVYLPDGTGFYSERLTGDAVPKFGAKVLPQPFEIKPEIALPNFIPLKWLISPSEFNASLASRSRRSKLMDAVASVFSAWPPDQAQFSQRAPGFFNSLKPIFRSGADSEPVPSTQSMELARNLLFRIANIEFGRLRELSDAIAEGEDGHANALANQINEQLAKRLNFPKWWVQDKDFSLRLTPREMDLVFTVRDRTGTEYTFGERSAGLKYFLSYLIQSQCRERQKQRNEILLMDEPDAYLSAEAQQDLLKIFDDFANPETDVAPVQVIFVTHSPFLIDKNHAERIRVLEKGKGLDGTRVVKNVSQNHYEPLRSAFGAFVGETAFIGACNILLEGASDQIILAGAARILRRRGKITEHETLDLNRLVLVPCGSAMQVPYMLFLIRGRGGDKPPVIVLLDSDLSGDKAARMMRGEDKNMRRLIRKEYVIQIAEVYGGDGLIPKEIEDLVPLPLAAEAVNCYVRDVSKYSPVQVPELNSEALAVAFAGGTGIFDGINKWADTHDFHVEKIGFARSVVEACESPNPNEEIKTAIDVFLGRMRQLFKRLNQERRKAERDSLVQKVVSRVEQQQAIFVRDHPERATKEQAMVFVENVDHVLDDSVESDAVRNFLLKLRRKFELNDATRDPVHPYPEFLSDIAVLKDAFKLEQLNADQQLPANPAENGIK